MAPLLTTGTSALTWKPQQCGLPSALTGSLRTSVVFTYCTLLYADTGDVTGILFFLHVCECLSENVKGLFVSIS